MRGAATLLAAATLVGCSGTATEAVLVEHQAVRGGDPTGTSHAGVLYVMSEIRSVAGQQVNKFGSSALVAPNLLATALHVVSQSPSNVAFTCDANGDVIAGSSGASLGATVAPEKVRVYAGPTPTGEPLAYGVSIVSTGSTTICQNDLAFVVLDHALDLPTYPIRRGNPVALGDGLTVVGYGSGFSTPPESAVRTQLEVSVAAVGQWIRTFTVTAGPCEGDSGGPALTAAGELAGIFSSVAVDCTATSAAPKYTDLSYFAPLAERAFEEAGAGSPWAPPTAGGEGGAGGESGGGPAGDAGRSAAGGEEAVEPEPTPGASGGCAVANVECAGNAGNAGIALLLAGVALYRRVSRRGRT